MTDSVPASSTPSGESTRRQFLTVALTTAAGVAIVRFAGLGLDFYQPVTAANQYGGVFELGALDDLPAVGEPPLHHAEGRFYLMRTEAGLLALHKVCTHLDCLLGWDEQNRRYLCPCHGSQFAADGQVLSGPAERSLSRFVVRLTTDEGGLVAETDSAAGAPLPVPAADQPEADDTGDAAADDGTAVAEAQPALLVWVDTGRKITSAGGA
jgi:cytochrome b6-f complex iron-sulfur subunit